MNCFIDLSDITIETRRFEDNSGTNPFNHILDNKGNCRLLMELILSLSLYLDQS